MRRMLALLAIGAALVACRDRAAPTENRAGPEFAVVGNGGGGGPTRYVSNGLGAYASWTSGDSAGGSWYTGVYLSADQVSADTMGAAGVAVYWFVNTCDETGTWCEYSYGGGRLPSSVLTARAQDVVHLAFDPASYPDLLWMQGDSLGPVDVTWTRDRSYTSINTGTSEQRWPNCWYRSQGTWQESGARVAGYATPWVIPAGITGYIHSNRQRQMSFCR